MREGDEAGEGTGQGHAVQNPVNHGQDFYLEEAYESRRVVGRQGMGPDSVFNGSLLERAVGSIQGRRTRPAMDGGWTRWRQRRGSG